MRKQRMTQADLAQQLSVPPKAVSRRERGIGFPDIDTLAPLAEALDVSLQKLMRSERTAAPLSQEAAAKMMSDTGAMAREGVRRRRLSPDLRRTGPGLALRLLHSIGVDGWDLAYGLYQLFLLITGRLCR